MDDNTDPNPDDSSHKPCLLVIDPGHRIPEHFREALLSHYPDARIRDNISEEKIADPGVVIILPESGSSDHLSLIASARTSLPRHQRIVLLPSATSGLLRKLMHLGANECLDFSRSAEELLSTIQYHLDQAEVSTPTAEANNSTGTDELTILRQREALYRSLFELSDDANMTLDQNGFIDCNHATLRMFGYSSKAEFLGKHPSEISPDYQADGRDSRSAADERMATATEQGRNFFEWTHKRANGEVFPATVLLTRITHNNRTFLQAIVRDITEYKQFEKELMVARDEAEYANNAKSEFLARMSHELRTPLNAILGFGQLLQLDANSMSSEQRENTNHIVSSGRHLLRLIDEILDIVRADTGAIDINLTNINLRHALDQSLILMKPLAAKNGIRLENFVADNLYMVADEGRLKQVMINLISNAIKYNRSNGSVRITAEIPESNKIRLTIADTGVGIQAEDHATLFDPFRRADISAATPDGTGIGLTISKKLVELMGGTIGFASRVNEGSEFWIEFPAAMPIPDLDTGISVAGIRDKDPQSGSQITVLYVEDNRSGRELVQQTFSCLNGFSYLGAGNGKDGLELARRNRPDIILLDINLPDMSGFDVLEKLRQDPETANIPVIALTANALNDQVEAGKKAGFEEYLTKPFSLSKLLKILRKYNINRIEP